MNALVNDVRESLKHIDGISTLSMFGSRCSGRARSDSDLDVAVLTECNDAISKRKLLSDIAVALAHLAPEGRIDIVFIDEAPDLLRQRIMERGYLVQCSNPELWKKWRIRTMREFGDREPVRRMFRVAQQHRLQRGVVDGRSGLALQSARRAGRISG